MAPQSFLISGSKLCHAWSLDPFSFTLILKPYLHALKSLSPYVWAQSLPSLIYPDTVVSWILKYHVSWFLWHYLELGVQELYQELGGVIPVRDKSEKKQDWAWRAFRPCHRPDTWKGKRERTQNLGRGFLRLQCSSNVCVLNCRSL